MNTLSENWISEGWIDFEYKKYILLGYLQNVNVQFKEVKLYPPLADLIRHYERLQRFNDSKKQLKLSFPKDVSGLDFENLQVNYESRLKEDEMMTELADIVAFALPKIKTQIEEGKTIYEFLEANLQIEPIGISPLYQREGYAILSFDHSKDVYVYRYTLNLFQSSADVFRGIALKFIQKIRHSLVNTFQKIKMDLVKDFSDLPNPSAWRIHSTQAIPLDESFVPISKRLLLKTIAV
nr:hypothetical protein [Cytophagales bacterium]